MSKDFFCVKYVSSNPTEAFLSISYGTSYSGDLVKQSTLYITPKEKILEVGIRHAQEIGSAYFLSLSLAGPNPDIIYVYEVLNPESVRVFYTPQDDFVIDPSEAKRVDMIIPALARYAGVVSWS